MHDIATALQNTALPRLNAQRLLLHALGRAPDDRAWLLAHDRDLLERAAWQRFQDLCGRHTAGEPMGYLLGYQDFYSLKLAVDARVLVPRPDTETLVDWALELLTNIATPQVIDLGTGSGAIALAIASQRPDAQVTGVDASADALDVARENAQALGLGVVFRLGNWLGDGSADGPDFAVDEDSGQASPHASPLPKREGASQELPESNLSANFSLFPCSERAAVRATTPTYHLIAANPPYIAPADPHLTALTHEPAQALVAADNGLADLQTIATQAPARLLPGSWLLLEHGYDQAAAVQELMVCSGLVNITTRHDLQGNARVTGGQRPVAR